MTAIKVKGLTIRKLQAPETKKETVKKETVIRESPMKNMWGLLTQFVVIGGDFV